METNDDRQSARHSRIRRLAPWGLAVGVLVAAAAAAPEALPATGGDAPDRGTDASAAGPTDTALDDVETTVSSVLVERTAPTPQASSFEHGKGIYVPPPPPPPPPPPAPVISAPRRSTPSSSASSPSSSSSGSSAPRQVTSGGGGGAGGALASIRACESGGNYGAVSSSGSYRGAYQFDRGTWNSVAGRHNPALVGQDPAAAAPADQDALASALMAERGSSPWPVCGN